MSQISKLDFFKALSTFGEYVCVHMWMCVHVYMDDDMDRQRDRLYKCSTNKHLKDVLMKNMEYKLWTYHSSSV